MAEAPENTEGNTKSHKAHHTALRFILTPGVRPTRSLVTVRLPALGFFTWIYFTEKVYFLDIHEMLDFCEIWTAF